jgi:hypothetical protein
VRLAAILLAGVVALGLAGPAGSSLLYSTVAKAKAARGEPPHAYVALDRRGTTRFSAQLQKEDRQRVAGVDFRRFAVVAAFVTLPTPCHAYDIASIERRRRTLVVSLVIAGQEGPCILPITPAYHVVKVRRQALGARPPARAVLHVARWYASR